MGSFEDKKATGTVFNIQKYSVHDGPGIRTIVFLTGCTLACRWCSNPESQSPKRQLAYNEGRCLSLAKCMRCVKVCTQATLPPEVAPKLQQLAATIIKSIRESSRAIEQSL